MLSNHPNCLGGNGPSASSDLIGDVDGPASATDNAVARFDGTTGKLIQNSVVTIADTTGDIAGASSLTSPAATNLTLAGGAGNSSIILTPAGTGNVGIGTTAPATSPVTGLLTVSGATETHIVIQDTSDSNVGLVLKNASDGNSWLISHRNANNGLGLYYHNGTSWSSELVTVLNGGNVGIGTTGPTEKFHVLDTSTTNGEAGIYLSKTGATNGTSYGMFSTLTGAATTNIAGYFSATNATNNYGLIVAYGNVGIGTTSPAGLLDVSTSNVGTDNSVFFRNTENTHASSGVRVFAQVGGLNAGDPRFVFSILGTQEWCVGIDNSNSDKFIIGTDSTVDADPKLTIVPTTGDVTITSTTAGSSGAGALVVTGGLSAGQSAQASWFGGAVLISMANPELAIRSASDAAAQRQYLTFGSPTYNRAQFQSVSAGTSDGSLELRTFSAGSQVLSQTWNKDGSSTFAGAVTSNGNLTASGTSNLFSGASAVNQAANLFRSAAGVAAVYLSDATTPGATSPSLWLASSTDGMFLRNASGVLQIIDETTPAAGDGSVRFSVSNAGLVTIGGALKLGNTYVGTPVVSTGYITIQDNTGTTYKVAVSL